MSESPINFKDRSRPFCTTDAVILQSRPGVMWPNVVLIERAKAPFGWALPGGHVEYGESLEQCCVREVKEETGLDIYAVEQFYTYSLPDRDPRSHTMSTVFIASCKADAIPVAGDDAAKAHLIPLDEALRLDYAFDHRMIIEDVVIYLNGGFRRTYGA
jgi:8-oxo-dGTP diphosphatase